MKIKEYVISVDLGGANVRVGLISSECEIIKVYSEPTIKKDKVALVEQVCRLIEKLPYEEYHVKQIGVSACGFVKHNFIRYISSLEIHDLDLKKEIEARFPYLNVTVKNDCDCTAVSEATYGASKDYENSFFINFSAGMGGALIHHHHLEDLRFEIGHMFIEYNNQIFEVEQLLSGDGIIRLCRENNLLISSAVEFFSLVRQNDYKATNILEIWKRETAILVSNIQLLLNVDTFVFGGGLMQSSDLFLQDVAMQANDLIRKFPLKPIKILLPEFNQDARLIGGASIIFNQ